MNPYKNRETKLVFTDKGTLGTAACALPPGMLVPTNPVQPVLATDDRDDFYVLPTHKTELQYVAFNISNANIISKRRREYILRKRLLF